MKERLNARLFSNAYTPVQQGAMRKSVDAWHDDFLGQIRFDTLLAGTLVIPDTYIFDGAYFLDTMPSELAASVGRGITHPQMPIEIRSRAPTLEESLARFLDRADGTNLNPFPFNAFTEDEVRKSLAESLGNTPAEKLHNYIRKHDGCYAAH
jgi:hypothetical protein